jgi:hypothetical protein
MSKKINFDFKSLQTKAKKLLPAISKHASFMIIMVMLATYLLVVLRISQLAGAEPPVGTEDTTTAAIPKVDKNAIDQIQALEQSNTQVKSLFDSARKNPFSE